MAVCNARGSAQAVGYAAGQGSRCRRRSRGSVRRLTGAEAVAAEAAGAGNAALAAYGCSTGVSGGKCSGGGGRNCVLRWGAAGTDGGSGARHGSRLDLSRQEVVHNPTLPALPTAVSGTEFSRSYYYMCWTYVSQFMRPSSGAAQMRIDSCSITSVYDFLHQNIMHYSLQKQLDYCQRPDVSYRSFKPWFWALFTKTHGTSSARRSAPANLLACTVSLSVCCCRGAG